LTGSSGVIRAPSRLQLSVAATAAALAAALLHWFGWDSSAAVSAVVVVGCIGEAWRRNA